MRKKNHKQFVNQPYSIKHRSTHKKKINNHFPFHFYEIWAILIKPTIDVIIICRYAAIRIGFMFGTNNAICVMVDDRRENDERGADK